MSNSPGNHHLPWANLNDQPHEEQILQLQITPFEVRVLRFQQNTDTIIKELRVWVGVLGWWFGIPGVPPSNNPLHKGLGWWFGILGVPQSNNPSHKRMPGIQTTNPNHQLTIGWKSWQWNFWFTIHCLTLLKMEHKHLLAGGWATHLKNMLVKLDHFPR